MASHNTSHNIETVRKDLPPALVEIVNSILDHIGVPVESANPSFLDKIINFAQMAWKFIKKFTSYSSVADQQALLQKYVNVVCPEEKLKKRGHPKAIAAYHRTLAPKKRSLDKQDFVTELTTLTSKLVGIKATKSEFYDYMDNIDTSIFENIVDLSAQSSDQGDDSAHDSAHDESSILSTQEPSVPPQTASVQPLQQPLQQASQLISSYTDAEGTSESFSILASAIQCRIGTSKIVLVLMN